MTTTPTQEYIESLIKTDGLTHKGVPMAMFNKYEPMFRKYMRANKLRAIYRGPRISNKRKYSFTGPSMTMRCDAKFVKFYGV